MNEARVIYDFECQNSDELSLRVGEIVTVVSQNVGPGYEGWWLGRNSAGREGYIPENFVELLAPPEPAMPPPPPPPPASAGPAGAGVASAYYGQTQHQQQQQPIDANARSSAFFADESWSSDDDDDGATAQQPQQYYQQQQQQQPQYQQQPQQQQQQQLPGGGGVTLRASEPGATGMKRATSVTLSMQDGKQQDFRKLIRVPKVAGIREYLLMENCAPSNEDSPKLSVTQDGEDLMWCEVKEPFTCEVKDPSKNSKMKGLKSFIAYHISTSRDPTLIVVRRYKHFDWLLKQLIDKFPCVTVPPLPDKQVTGRYEENFINTRMRQLHTWLNRMSQHPVVGSSQVLHHFLTCADDSKRWKDGKRRAEQDKLAKGFIYFTIEASPIHDWDSIERFTDTYDHFTNNFDNANKQALDIVLSFGRKCESNISKEYARLADAYNALDKAIQILPNDSMRRLSEAMHTTSVTYNEVSKLWTKQPQLDADPLAEQLHDYTGLLSSLPAVVSIGRSAVQTARDSQRGQQDGRLLPDEAEEIKRKAGVVASAQCAEMAYVQRCAVNDYRYMMQLFLAEQIRFHQEIASKLQVALDSFSE